MSSMMSTDVFYQMPADSDLYKDQYDVKAGRWPKSYNECVLVLTSGGGMSDLFAVHAGLKRSVGAGRDGCGIRRGRADRSSERFNCLYI